jgi:quinol-cytochrome oxidoreductase complex cytochrome b subunit
MHLYNIAAAAIEHMLGQMLRRALFVLVVAVFAIVAMYQFTIAGTLALETQYGTMPAHLIVAAVYAAVALITFAILWATGRKGTNASAAVLTAPREMQMAMLVEAVMLGYALARKGERAS